MDGHLTTAIVSILTAVVSVALLATFLSQKSNTANIINASGSAYSNILATALGPITGFTPGGSSGFSTNGITGSINL